MMTELDFLKEHWNKQDNFQVIKRDELHLMIKKSSSNILKWLIAVNLFELTFFVSISLIFGSNNNDVIKNELLLDFVSSLDYLIFGLPIVFSLIYLYLIRKINVTDSVSLLLKNIFKARKLLNIYIYINLFIFLLIMYVGIYLAISSNEVKSPPELSNFSFNVILILTCIVLSVFFMFTVWLFYKLLYGKLLKKLNKNYEELNDLN